MSQGGRIIHGHMVGLPARSSPRPRAPRRASGCLFPLTAAGLTKNPYQPGILNVESDPLSVNTSEPHGPRGGNIKPREQGKQAVWTAGGKWPPEPEDISPKPVLPSLSRRGSGWELPPFTLVPSFLGTVTLEFWYTSQRHSQRTRPDGFSHAVSQPGRPSLGAAPASVPGPVS